MHPVRSLSNQYEMRIANEVHQQIIIGPGARQRMRRAAQRRTLQLLGRDCDYILLTTIDVCPAFVSSFAFAA